MEYCMRDGCTRLATKFESDDYHWHDWLWCDEHAKGRPVEEYIQKKRYPRYKEE